MDIIPVIDVRHGEAVAAVRGQRADYRPLATALAAGSEPAAVARGYLSLYRFTQIYVADLDGIEGRGPNGGLVAGLHAAMPDDVRLWIDDGTPAEMAAARLAGAPHDRLVIGTESLRQPAALAALRALPADGYVLSLDFKGEAFDGPPEVLADNGFWPEAVIVMTLGRVGSREGPDLARLSDVVARAGGRRVYAAGGVRHRADLLELASIGVAGALVATALHAGTIKAGDLREVAGL